MKFIGAPGVSVVRNSEVVRYWGTIIELRKSMGVSIGASSLVRYKVDVRYSECPLMEVPYPQILAYLSPSSASCMHILYVHIL